MNLKRSLLFSFLLIICTSTSYSENIKIIQLKDGSVLKGTVQSLVDGTYQIQTNNLGQVDIYEEDILSISNPNLSGGLKGSQQAISLDQMKNQDIAERMESIQSTFMNDPEIMKEVEGMLNNEDMMNLINDEDFMNKVMDFNTESLAEDERTLKLIEDPQMKALMQKIQGKISLPQQ